MYNTKRNLFKRFLSFGLAVIMLLSTILTLTTAVSAQNTAPFADVETGANDEALRLLADLGVIKGTGANVVGEMEFTPDRNVTRQEMALFIARIRSATPEYFIKDASQQTIFSDVTDSTFFTAINYCVEMDIIDGFPDGTFRPNDTVTFQEAVKMMVTALGYTALSYPVGYLSKASEPGVDLLGGFNNIPGTKTMTRIEIAQLLYNYFLSNYNYVDVTYNSIDKKYESTLITKPVCEKFGVEKTTAYITGIQDFSIDLVVKDTRLTAGEVTLTGSPLTAKETTTGTRNDILVSYYTTESSTVAGTTTVAPRVASVKMSKTSLGYSADTDTADLLGLKVTIYRSIRNNNVTVPTSFVTGTKTKISSITDETLATAATIEGDNYDVIKNLIIGGRSYDLSTPPDITNEDIYSFGTTTKLVNTRGTVLELARMIANKGYYVLEYVNNGRDNQGNPEEYYIFTPMEVGYYNGVNSDGKIQLEGSAKDKTDSDLIKNLKAGGTTVTLTKGEAYLYTLRGNHLDVYKQLVRVATDVSPSYVYNNVAAFPNITATFGKETQYLATNALSAAVNNITVGGTYTLFAPEAGGKPFYAFQTKEPTSATAPKNYAVITSAATASGIVNGKPAHLYSVVTQEATSAVTSMMITMANGSEASAGSLSEGHVISYRKVGDAYEVYTSGDAGFKNTAEGLGIAINSTSTDKLVRGTDFTYSANSGLLSTLVTGAGSVARTGLITGNTKIILVKENFTDARAISRDEFNSIMGAAAPDTKKLTMVTKSATASEAIVVVVTAHTAFTTVAPTNNYAMVTTPNRGVTQSGYYFATAYSYSLGSNIEIATADASSLSVGNILRITDRTEVVGGTTFYIADTSGMDTDLLNAPTDFSKIKDLSVPAQQLVSFSNKVVVSYGTTPTVKTLNDKDVNVITVTLYTGLTTGAANTTGASTNWVAGTNMKIDMARSNLSSINSADNTVIFTDTDTSSDNIYKYYVHTVDPSDTGRAGFITIIRYVVDSTETTFPV